MTIKQQIDQDLKAAMLAGQKTLVMTLRGLKAAILNVEVAEGVRETGLSDEKVTSLLVKEAKKRQESADMYKQGGNQERANAELDEKKIIHGYLPAQITEDELKAIIESTIRELGAVGPQSMGQVIGSVKQKTAGQADGAMIAQLVKDSLNGAA